MRRGESSSDPRRTRSTGDPGRVRPGPPPTSARRCPACRRRWAGRSGARPARRACGAASTRSAPWTAPRSPSPPRRRTGCSPRSTAGSPCSSTSSAPGRTGSPAPAAKRWPVRSSPSSRPVTSRRPQRKYYPRVAARAGIPWLRGPKAIRASRTRMQGVWSDAVARVSSLDEDGARALLLTGRRRVPQVIYHHTVLTLGAVQPVYDLLAKVAPDRALRAATDGRPRRARGDGDGARPLGVLARADSAWKLPRGLRLSRTPRGRHLVTTWREDPGAGAPVGDRVRRQTGRRGPAIGERAQKRAARSSRHDARCMLRGPPLAADRAAPRRQRTCRCAAGQGRLPAERGRDARAARRLGELGGRRGASARPGGHLLPHRR